MNIIITLYLFTGVSILFNGKLVEGNKFTNSLKEDIDFDKECRPESTPCVVKCCGDKEVFKMKNKIKKCMNIDELSKQYDLASLKKELMDYSGLRIMTADKKDSKKTLNDFHVVYRKDFESLDVRGYSPYSMSYATLMENGELEIFLQSKYSPALTRSARYYCVEQLVGYSKRKAKVINQYSYYIFYDDNTGTKFENDYVAYGYLVSSFFLCLVVVVYGLLKPLRSNLHGILLMVFMVSLTALMLFIVSTTLYENKVVNDNVEYQKRDVCKWISPITYYLNLSTFFWMNVMCYDIWWTFRGTRKVRQIHRRGVNVKLIIYSLYAWGLPLLITIATIIIDRSDDVPLSVIKPKFEECFHLQGWARLYKYLPMIVLVSANVVLYLMTIYNIWAVKRHMVSIDSTQNKKNKNQFVVYLKLSVIMGLSWIIELIQALVNDDVIPSWLFFILSAFNVFIGVIIFFILIFKRSIFVMLCKRFKVENRWTRQSTNVTRTRTECSNSKASKSYAKTKCTDDSMEFESMALSNADTMKVNHQNLQNPRFSVTRV